MLIVDIRSEWASLRSNPIFGNAYSDHDLVSRGPELAIAAASANLPDLAFEIYDFIGTRGMGLEPLTWNSGIDSFEANLKFGASL